ncbi:tetratricopeptide repeat protein [Vibrio diabolicus]|uniref:tetratricopeptide repeat protein n=2 Tax=Vibrio harveyi group TaxID=717610 RepID=UPI00215EC404|nr:tetratricopeptide repeat protein [Vibrio diabolicus]MCS0379364.1 sel1 repeat family protein [Vibrio diabolicus]MCS0422621.1 sel1 repeat family protein [Vibrio diabolicus]
MNKLFTPILILLLSGCSTHNRDTVFAEKAAEQGDAFASIKKAAEQGYAPEQDALGVMYYKGEGVLKDYKQAVSWYRKAAEQGYASAQNNLGFMYGMGEGVIQDYNQAFSWYRKAAEQGFATAQFNLGVMYGEGQGVLQDNKKALMWFHLARKNGSSDAYSMIKLLVPSMTYTDAQKALDASKICLESGYKKCG